MCFIVGARSYEQLMLLVIILLITGRENVISSKKMLHRKINGKPYSKLTVPKEETLSGKKKGKTTTLNRGTEMSKLGF